MSGDAFSPALAARRVLRLAATGSLATLDPEGGPFASLVTVATTPAGDPILLLSTLARHTRNLAADRRASLLLVAPGGEGGDPLAGARLTLTGTVGPADTDPLLRRRFLARHTEAAGYADFADFGFHRFAVEGGHLVAGFGRIVSLSPADILIDVSAAGDLIAAEAERARPNQRRPDASDRALCDRSHRPCRRRLAPDRNRPAWGRPRRTVTRTA